MNGRSVANVGIEIGAAFAGNFKTVFGAANDEVGKIGGAIKKLEGRQKELNAVIKEQERLGAKGSPLKALYAQQEIDQITNKLGKLRAEQEKIIAQRARMAKLTDAQTANTARRGELRGQMFDAVALGAALAAPVRTAMRFEQAMAEVGAVARATGDQMSALTKTARHLGATTNWSASQAAEGMKFLAMAGFKTEQVISAMPGMLNLASAGATDLGLTADIASNILSGFGLRAEEMGRVGDVLTNTFTSSNSNLQNLGETMKYVAPVAKALGVSIEETAAMAGKLHDAGIQGSMAGTALRSVMLRLASSTPAVTKGLEQLGVKTMDAAGNMRSMPAILDDINKATKSMGSGARTALLTEIFGTEAATAAIELLDKAGEGLATYTESLKESGSAARVAAEQNNTATGAMKRLGSAVESMAISLGNVLLPPLAMLADKLAGVVGVVVSLAEQFPTLTKVIVIGTAALVAMKIAAIAGGYAFTFLKGAWLAAAVMGMKLAPVLSAVAFGIKAIGVALMSTPIGRIITGITLAGIYLWQNWDSIKTGMVDIFTTVRDVAVAAFDSLKSAVGSVIDWLAEKTAWIFSTVDKVRAAASSVGSTIGGWFGGGQSQAGSAAGATPAAVPAGAGGARVGTVDNTMNNNIVINAAPGTNESAVAEQVRRELARHQREQEARRRSGMVDSMGY